MERFDGTGVALVTPFDEKRNIDEESLRRLVEHVIAGGVDFLVALGTTAECATLSVAEKARIVEIIIEVNQGRLPIMVGMGGNNTAEVVREIQQTDWLRRCQGILSITPFYNKPTQEGLFEHFKAIASATELPLCLYNVPSRTGVNLCASTVAQLAKECPNIKSLKEASGSFEQATAVLKQKRDDMTFFSGDDSLLMPLMAIGFDGVISVAANVIPQKYVKLVKSMKNGHWTTAQQLHLELADFSRLLY